MFKFALCFGIGYEWICGPDAVSLQSIGASSLRALLATMLAWMVLEGLRAVYLSIMTLDSRPPRRT
jgi:hypothetical protein